MYKVDFNRNIVISILEKTSSTLELEEGTVEIIDNVQMQVTDNNNMQTYWVECYYMGEHDSYVLRIYNRDNSKDTNITDEGLMSVTDLDSCGNTNYVTLYEDIDTKIEEAIMETLFGKDGIIIPF